MTKSLRLAVFLVAFCAVNTGFIGLLYSYSALTWGLTFGGWAGLAGAAWFLLQKRDWPVLVHRSWRQARTLAFGLAVGGLWVVETGLNNLAQPALPARNLIDGGFWLVITLVTLGFCARKTFRTGRAADGWASGFLVGAASGLVACATALAFVAWGMDALKADPVNLAQWQARGPASGAPTLDGYLAFETLAGALWHLFGLGALGGTLLGGLGAALGLVSRRMGRRG